MYLNVPVKKAILKLHRVKFASVLLYNLFVKNAILLVKVASTFLNNAQVAMSNRIVNEIKLLINVNVFKVL